MKVKPGMGEDYQKLESVWKKIHEAKIKEGKLQDWALYSIMSPYGSNTEYNYVAMNIYVGEDQLASHFAYEMPDLKTILSADEMAMVEKTSEYRTLVKEEIFRLRDHTYKDKPFEVCVVNYMKSKPGFMGRDMGAMEAKYWKPVHLSSIESGDRSNWGMYSLEYPYGSSSEYNAVTVDFFEDMSQLLATPSEDVFKKVHPNESFSNIMKETTKVRSLVKAEIWKRLDETDNRSNSTNN
ncbi:MAG: hypothetical protein AAGK97_15540 [Bacteroidota bacterium]